MLVHGGALKALPPHKETSARLAVHRPIKRTIYSLFLNIVDGSGAGIFTPAFEAILEFVLRLPEFPTPGFC